MTEKQVILFNDFFKSGEIFGAWAVILDDEIELRGRKKAYGADGEWTGDFDYFLIQLPLTKEQDATA